MFLLDLSPYLRDTSSNHEHIRSYFSETIRLSNGAGRDGLNVAEAVLDVAGENFSSHVFLQKHSGFLRYTDKRWSGVRPCIHDRSRLGSNSRSFPFDDERRRKVRSKKHIRRRP